jgi:hypothetical protein
MSKFHTNQLAGFPEKSGRWQMQVHKGLRGCGAVPAHCRQQVLTANLKAPPLRS